MIIGVCGLIGSGKDKAECTVVLFIVVKPLINFIVFGRKNSVKFNFIWIFHQVRA